jgi:mRNA interferase RelE/StbE
VSAGYTVVLAQVALDRLKALADRRMKALIFQRIQGLSHDPELQGKAMSGDLAGYRSLRAAGQRWRILYRVDRGKVTVLVVALGPRKEGDSEDVYALAHKLMRRGLMG